jgi:hypothetical protein
MSVLVQTLIKCQATRGVLASPQAAPPVLDLWQRNDGCTAYQTAYQPLPLQTLCHVLGGTVCRLQDQHSRVPTVDGMEAVAERVPPLCSRRRHQGTLCTLCTVGTASRVVQWAGRSLRKEKVKGSALASRMRRRPSSNRFVGPWSPIGHRFLDPGTHRLEL